PLSLTVCYECGGRDETTIALRELRALPDVPEQHGVGELGELWREVADGLLCGAGWLIRFHVVVSSHGVIPTSRRMSFTVASGSWAQQRLDRAALVHRTVAFPQLVQGQGRVEHLAGVYFPVRQLTAP